MIQLCPHCEEQWCESIEEGTKDRALRGFGDTMSKAEKVGEAIGSLFGKTGKNAGGTIASIASTYNPMSWVKAGAEVAFGDRYKFVCPNCGWEWSTDDEEDDQTEEYEEWCEQQEKYEVAFSLIGNTASMAEASQEEQINHIAELEALLDEDNSKFLNTAIYNALAYSQFVFFDDSDSAVETIIKSRRLRLEPVTDAILGMIVNAYNDTPLNKYGIMQYLVKYKEIDEDETFTHFTMSQFRERFEEFSRSYIDGFMQIPSEDRRFLVIDDELRSLPDSFMVLPLRNIPNDIVFPSGHPRSQELYVVHPYKPNEYIPYNDYQLSLFRDEIHEFAWIMECLGAKSISFHEDHMNEQKTERRIDKESGGGASFKGYSAKGSYRRGETKDDYEKLTEELMKAKVFSITPNVAPFIPQDVVWYQHRSEWQRDCESRQAGRLLKASFRLSTNRITAASEQERKKIEADLQILLFKANGSHEQEENISLRSEESHTWTVDVEFYPLNAYNTSNSNKEMPQNTQSATFTSEEEEYLTELKDILADGEISPRERRLLDKIRIQYGISEARAAELENSLTALQLTEEEKEYLDEYKDVISDGEITEKACRLLDKFRKLNGISEERAREIEASVKR